MNDAQRLINLLITQSIGADATISFVEQQVRAGRINPTDELFIDDSVYTWAEKNSVLKLEKIREMTEEELVPKSLKRSSRIKTWRWLRGKKYQGVNVPLNQASADDGSPG